MKSSGSFQRAGYLRENYRFFHLRDTAGQELDFHFHEFDKLVILLSGRVDYTVESAACQLRPWDVLLIKHHTIHRAVIDRAEPYDRVILYLDSQYLDRIMPAEELMGCFELADRQRRHLLSPEPAERERLQRYVAALEEAQNDEQFGAQALREACLVQLLVLVNRMVRSGGQAARSQPLYDAKITQALSYINENLTRDITVEELAEQVFLSKYYFMRLFKAQTGASVHGYLRQKRLLNAARLIREGTPVNKAASDSGFRDYSAFYRAFRESFGVSPRELK